MTCARYVVEGPYIRCQGCGTSLTPSPRHPNGVRRFIVLDVPHDFAARYAEACADPYFMPPVPVEVRA